MSDQCRTAGSGNPGVSPEIRKESSSSVADKSGKPEKTEKRTSRRYPDMQSAVRFPIKEMPVGSMVDFTISLPAEVVGAEADVQLDCRGRVVRNFEEGGRRGVGVVIDEYRFERH